MESSLKRQKIIPALIIAVLIVIFVAKPVYALNCGEPNAPKCLSEITGVLQRIISYLAPVAGIAFLVMILVAGFQFLTSGGDQKAVAGARTTLTYAIIGIILVVVSWLILLLIKQITGVETTIVNIPESQ